MSLDHLKYAAFNTLSYVYFISGLSDTFNTEYTKAMNAMSYQNDNSDTPTSPDSSEYALIFYKHLKISLIVPGSL